MSVGRCRAGRTSANMNKKLKTQPKAEVQDNLRVTKQYDTIKLGIDWHARQYCVVRLIDNAGPEPAQRFSPEGFVVFARKQLLLAKAVCSCYEAGAGGFVLHRQLQSLGVKNYVVHPRKLDRANKRVQNDRLDARELALDLDRFVRGNAKALRCVHVPAREAERLRQQSRQRQQLVAHRLRLAAQGRQLLLGQGWVCSNFWWKPTQWSGLAPQLPQWLCEALEVFRRLIEAVNVQLRAMTKTIAASAPVERPKGLGALSFSQIGREVCDWKRFKNRKALGSYAGLVGGVSSSGPYTQDLSLTKAGNRRLRTLLVEAAWRFVLHQGECALIQKWRAVLLNPKAHKRARKRAIVAVARALLIELWRWQTGRKTPQQLGWIMHQ
jgi:transposase